MRSASRNYPTTLALAAFGAVLGLTSCQGCRSGSPNPAQVAGAADAGSPTVRLVFLTDLAGALEPCGCMKDQLGGLNHFGAWVKSGASAGSAPFVAAAGPLFFMDTKLGVELADQDRAKAEAMARALHGLNFVAFAPGENDWADGAANLVHLADESGGRLVGTALSPETRGPAALTKTIETRLGPIRIGFVGVGAPPPGAPLEAPAEDLARGIAAATAEGANVLVALAAVGRGEAKRLAEAHPELAAVVVGSPRSNGDQNTDAPQGEQVGPVLIAQGANHLQTAAVLDLYLRDRAEPGKLLRFADATGLELAERRGELARRIDDLHVKIAVWEGDHSVSAGDLAARRAELGSLETERATLNSKPPPAQGSFFRYSVQEIRDSLGKDPVIEAGFLAYYKAVNEHNRSAFAGRLPPPAADGHPTYVGNSSCSDCHAAPRQVWNGTAHAHAYATLATQFKEFNLDCVGCHVTGYEKPGGSTVTHVSNLRDVGCEVCHGPGSNHVENPTLSNIVRAPSPELCLQCHHPPHVEQFDAVARMKDILGVGHGLPAKAKAKAP